MSYTPNSHELDFEIGAFGSRIKKGFKKVSKGVGKVADVTIAKPTAFVGGLVGGKKGRRFGEKLGKGLAKVTTIGTVAGIGGAAAPALAGAAPAILTGVAGKKLIGRKKRKFATLPASKKSKTIHKRRSKSRHPKSLQSRKSTCTNSALAAEVAAKLVSKLGGPITQANRALKLAELQREATFEHRKLMSDAEFRKKVLSGIVSLAESGNQNCGRTVKVLMGRA